jgi:hypothetical protein
VLAQLPRWVAVLSLIVPGAIGLFPILCVVVAGLIANRLGCRLDEGSVHACPAGGFDLGPILYQLGVMGWFALVTIPMALLMYGLVAIVWIVALVQRRNQRAS